MMVNDRASDVGCALVRFTKDDLYHVYFTCNYGSNNHIDFKVYETGPGCSKCNTGCSRVWPGLCSAEEKVDPNHYYVDNLKSFNWMMMCWKDSRYDDNALFTPKKIFLIIRIACSWLKSANTIHDNFSAELKTFVLIPIMSYGEVSNRHEVSNTSHDRVRGNLPAPLENQKSKQRLTTSRS